MIEYAELIDKLTAIADGRIQTTHVCRHWLREAVMESANRSGEIERLTFEREEIVQAFGKARDAFNTGWPDVPV
jgi:hypothetical protein